MFDDHYVSVALLALDELCSIENHQAVAVEWCDNTQSF